MIVGFDTSDDACVYRITDEIAAIHTVDFFTPIVDDPFWFGQIAAANALSDVYAMGGRPAVAMNLLCVPGRLSQETIRKILEGGHQKAVEAGCVIAGGHTIQDDEPKYGLCVTGFIHPDHVMENSNCKEGDLLVLTKPLGIGVLTTANKAQLLDQQTYDQMVEAMATLNKYGKDVMMEVGANACTDVTGFGLVGHASEMAKGSDVTIELFSKDIPIIEAAIDFAKMGIIPSGAYNNLAFVKDDVQFADSVPQHIQDLLVDPITSGGLLISLPEEKAYELVEKLKGVTICNAIVGRVVKKQEKAIVVL
mgnify:CR=1 FL=1